MKWLLPEPNDPVRKAPGSPPEVTDSATSPRVVHFAYEGLARERRGNEEYHQGYAEARQVFLIGQAVRERRLTLGLSQVELAARADMNQPALSRLETGGVVPSIPLLERISMALDADLVMEISPHAALSGAWVRATSG